MTERGRETMSSSSATRASRSLDVPIPWTRSGSSTTRKIEYIGSREP